MGKMKLSNWSERTPKFWKRIGDTALYGLPLLQTIIMASPLSTDIRLWTGFVLSVLLVGVKMLTKFFKEDS